MFNNIYKNYGFEDWIIKAEGLCYIVVYCVFFFKCCSLLGLFFVCCLFFVLGMKWMR